MRGRLLLFAAAVSLGLALAGNAAAVTDSYQGVTFSPFTIGPGNTDCADWNDPVLGWTKNCDPVDLIFPGQSLATVIERLHGAGWADTLGGMQYLQLADPAVLAPVQAQLQTADGPDPSMRYHVRLWEAAPDLTVGAVHHEHGTPHKIDVAWDTAEAFLAAPLCSTWCGHAALPVQASIEGPSGVWRGWGNDEIATVVPLAPPPVAQPAPKPRPKHARKRHPAAKAGS